MFITTATSKPWVVLPTLVTLLGNVFKNGNDEKIYKAFIKKTKRKKAKMSQKVQVIRKKSKEFIASSSSLGSTHSLQ